MTTNHPGHGHADGHDGHAHGVSAEADGRKLALALALIVAFMIGEVVAGILGHSLALLSDAAHMLTDAAALGLSLLAIRLAARPAGGSMTFGLKRSEILSAQFNGASLLVLGLLIVYGGVRRLVNPPPVSGSVVLIVALAGILVNLLASLVLARANRRSLNVEGAFQHMLTDLAAFIFTALAGALILATGFRRADGIAALIVAFIMLSAAYRLLRESGRVFLEAAPRGLEPDQIGRAMAAVPGVAEVHDLHVWEVTSGFPALSAHVLVGQGDECHEIGHRVKTMLHDRFEIDHTTLQVEHAPSQLLSIQPSPPGKQEDSA
ncbi:MAG TPA: cation diffusion facilitator family transporter [Solirubrobacteraceae bacterium]|nr:cation diffusion facilitator family transporter [Solirubrobacteraceae bacterium]